MTDPQPEVHRPIFIAAVVGMCAVLVTMVLLM